MDGLIKKIKTKIRNKLDMRESYYNSFKNTCLTCNGLSNIRGHYIKNHRCNVRYSKGKIIHGCKRWKCARKYRKYK